MNALQEAQPAQLVRSSSGATSADVRRLAARASARLGARTWGSALGSGTGMLSNGCDSIEASELVAQEDKIRTVSCAALIGEAIRRIANEESVSKLFD